MQLSLLFSFALLGPSSLMLLLRRLRDRLALIVVVVSVFFSAALSFFSYIWWAEDQVRNMRGSWWACRVILMSTIKWHFNGETITDIYINKTVQQSHWRPSLSPWYFSFPLNWLVAVFSCAQHFALASSSCDRHIIRATPHWNSWNILFPSVSPSLPFFLFAVLFYMRAQHFRI